MRGARAWVAALVAVVVVASACRASGTPKPAPTPTQPPPSPTIVIAPGAPIAIGVSAALSGDQASLGTDMADAADLAASDAGGTYGGHPLKVQRLDDGCSDPEKAVDVARSLIDTDGLIGVVGPMCTTGAQAADSVYEAAGVVHISPSATRIDLSVQGERYFFRTAWRDDAQASGQATYLRQTLSVTTAVLVDDGEPYGKGLADEFADAFAKAGGRVLSRERIARGTVDFSALAGQIQATGPDAVVYEGLDPEGALFVKALRGAGYTKVFAGPDGLLSARDFLATAGAAADGAVITGGTTPDDAFVAKFRDRFQRVPTTPFVLQAHDAVGALLQALATGSTQGADGSLVIDRAKLAEALRGQTFNGLTGTIRFDGNGNRRGETPAELGLAIYRVTNGQFQKVE